MIDRCTPPARSEFGFFSNFYPGRLQMCCIIITRLRRASYSYSTNGDNLCKINPKIVQTHELKMVDSMEIAVWGSAADWTRDDNMKYHN